MGWSFDLDDPFDTEGWSPTVKGIVVGGITAMASPFAVAGAGLGAAVGGTIGAFKDMAEGRVRDAERMFKQQQNEGIMNQNKLVEANYKKSQQARGLGEGMSPMGNQASQSGSVLTSVVQGNNSLIG